MPNVKNMSDRFQSHLARVNGKMMDREHKRIMSLWYDGKISHVTRDAMIQTAPIRLAWMANAQ